MLERCEKKILLDWRLLELPNRMTEYGMIVCHRYFYRLRYATDNGNQNLQIIF